MKKMANKTTLPLLLLLLLLLTFSPGGRGEGERRPSDPPGICRERFELFMEPTCANEACKKLCEGKNFERLWSSRCVDDDGCECKHLCPRHHRPPSLTLIIH